MKQRFSAKAIFESDNDIELGFWGIKFVGDVINGDSMGLYKEVLPIIVSVASLKALPRSLSLPPEAVRYYFWAELEPVRNLFQIS